MEVIYTNDSVESEPGPNLYWRGKPKEFAQFLFDAYELGVSGGTALDLQQLSYIRLVGIEHYNLVSVVHGVILAKVDVDNVLTELDPELWRQFLHNVLSISFLPSFVYQEISNPHLVEDANIIMSSAWTLPESIDAGTR
jgi:hypothetical protein